MIDFNSYNEDCKWIAETLKLAKAAAAAGEVPIGAVIVLNNKIIGSGQNRIEELQNATAHAEILAISEATQTIKNWRLDGAVIYVSLEPCQMCLGAIKNSRISRIVYATKQIAVNNYSPIIESCECSVLEKESAQILKEFFKNTRKIKLSAK